MSDAAANKEEITTMVMETARLHLKELTPAIFAALFTTYTDEDIMAFMGLRTKEELETERNKWHGGMTTYRTSFKLFLLIEKSTGSVIGRAGFHNWYAIHSRAELGYVMTDKSKRRMGYMSEAVAAIIRYGFAEMGLNRIEALIGPDNEPSLRIARALGFTQEGILRSHFCNDGKMVDSVMFSLLKTEYDPANESPLTRS